MMKRPGTVDSVAVSGAVVGVLSSVPGWLTFKENRIVPGDSLGLFGADGRALPAVILALWVVCLVFSLVRKSSLSSLVLGISANLVLVLSFVFAGTASTYLLEGQPVAARVSLGAGFWITLAAAYVVIFAARQRFRVHPLARNVISWGGAIVCLVFLLTGGMNNTSVMVEFAGREERFFQELGNHVFLVGVSVLVGTVIGVLLGFWANRSRHAEKPIFYITNITQTIPSLALFGLLIAPLSALSFAYPALRELGIRGIGNTPAIIALVIYSLLPIVRNTYVGLQHVEPAVKDAGSGMGMSRFQVLRKIEAPLAAPLILEGIRTAAVQSVGLTAVAALIGAGGLGWFVFQGLGQTAADLILLGAIPIIVIALVVDAVMRLFVKLATPREISGGS